MNQATVPCVEACLSLLLHNDESDRILKSNTYLVSARRGEFFELWEVKADGASAAGGKDAEA